MKCDTCEYKHGYILSADECGAGNFCVHCAKDHWHDGGPDTKEEYERQVKMPDPWIGCKDYKQLTSRCK